MRLSREGLPTRLLVALLLIQAASAAVLALIGSSEPDGAEPTRAANRDLVRQMQLTDLALWTGTNYCRHPSLADLFAPRSTHPSAMEHFPAGSLVPPPPMPETGPTAGIGKGRR